MNSPNTPKVNTDVQRAIEHMLHDRPVGYHPVVARAVGSVTAGIFLSQLLYWTPRTQNGDGWLWKTRDEITAETALTRYEQETARRLLREAGVLEEKRAGVPARIWYRIDLARLTELLAGAEREGSGPPSSRGKTNQLDGENPTGWPGETPPTISETTAEITLSNLRRAHALGNEAGINARQARSPSQRSAGFVFSGSRGSYPESSTAAQPLHTPRNPAKAPTSSTPAREGRPRGFVPAAAILREHRHPQSATPFKADRLAIGAYLREYAQALGDHATEKQTTTRACNLYERACRRHSELNLATFLNLLVEAYRLTETKKPQIRTGAVGYFFAVLEGLLGLRESAADALQEGPKVAPESPNTPVSDPGRAVFPPNTIPVSRSHARGQSGGIEPAKGAGEG